ncbi:MAG: tRNA pseudouridine(13) synthase TruD, partial [Candidatus Hodarchaeales archaeon]
MIEKNSPESVVGIHGYRTSQLLGTGGFIKRNFGDFVVREILPNGKILINGSEIGENMGGMFTHCCLWKSGLDTFSAIKILSNHWDISEDDIGYAGLKDANAETYQRISIWNYYITDLHTSILPNLKVFHPVRQKFAVKIGDLLGNYFEITIRNIKRALSKNEWEELKNSLESNGVLNFYGLQRFGTKRPILHLIGKHLLQ